MRLIVLQGEAMIADVVSAKESVSIGSGESCRLRIEHDGVPPELALVDIDTDGAWYVELVAADAALLLNGDPIEHRAPVHSGDELRILDFIIRVFPEFDDAAAKPQLGASRAAFERFVQAQLPPGALLKKADEAITIAPGQIDRVGRTNVAVPDCSTVEQFMDLMLRTLFESFAAHRAWLGLRRVNYGAMEYEEGRLITGQTAARPEVANHLKPRVLDRAQFVLVPVLSAAERMSILAGPLPGPDGPLGMVYLDSGDTGRRFDQTDLDFFVLTLRVFAHQLDAIFKDLARNRAAMIDGQVSVAHEIQARLTPRKLPQWPELQCGAFREPGRQRTGDIYDVLRLSNNLAALMIGRTTAVGALPSMLMSQAQTAFRVAGMHQDTPAIFLRSLNWILFDGQKDHPLDCLACVIDPATGQMRYSMAGQIGAYIIDRRGDARKLGGKQDTPALAVDKSTAYPLLSEQLDGGETLVLFSQGVTTAKNRKEETFGEERFVNLLCDGFGQLASAMLKDMLTDLRNFTEGGQQPDDITVILAHRVR